MIEFQIVPEIVDREGMDVGIATSEGTQ